MDQSGLCWTLEDSLIYPSAFAFALSLVPDNRFPVLTLRELQLQLCVIFLQLLSYCIWCLSIRPVYLIWSLVTGIPTGPTGGSAYVPRDGAGQRRWCTHLRCRLEDAELLGIGQGGVQRQDQHGGAAVREVLCNVSAGLAHGFDFLLAGEEHQDVLRGRGFLYKSESGTVRLSQKLFTW